MPTRLDQSSCVCYNNFLFRIKMRVKPPRDSYGLRASDWPFSVETMFAFPVFAWPFSVETMFVFPVFACQPADDTHKSRSFSFARQCSLFHSWLELSCYAGTTHLCWKKCWADLVSECSIYIYIYILYYIYCIIYIIYYIIYIYILYIVYIQSTQI